MQLKDLTGQRFGRLTVIERADSSISPNGSKKTMWRCKCDCGNEVVRCLANVYNVKYPSCGCWNKEMAVGRRLEDLTGQRFGRLVALRRDMESTSKLTKWICKCDCGNECSVIANNLKRGHTISCGCFREEVRPKQRFVHGYRHTRIYAVYSKIKERCINPKNPSYPRYGGRGITLCDEWMNDAKAFCEWAYEHGYKEDAKYGECTVDRIDNNKGYSPDNCRIVNEKVQANNRRSNMFIEHNGETKTLQQWAEHFGITGGKAHYYIVDKGYSIQDLIDKGIV